MKKSLFVILLLFLLQSVGYCTTIGEAKTLPTDTPVTLQGVVTYLETQECYIQSTNAPTGIWVKGEMDLVSLNDVVDVTGTTAVADGEKVISNAVVTRTAQQKSIIPVSMPNKSIAGASLEPALSVFDYQCLYNGTGIWNKACGANNTGLLAKTWGKVKAAYHSPTSSVKWFYIDDGSSVVSDLGDNGVIVYSDADVTEGDVVTVTGISSTEPSIDDPGKLIRVIMPAKTEDVQVEKKYQAPQPPFSSEFDGTTADPNWAVVCDPLHGGNVVFSREPGWVALDAPFESTATYVRTEMNQIALGSWDMEMKIRVAFDPNPNERTNQGFAIYLKSDRYNPDWYTVSWIAGFGYRQDLGGRHVSQFNGNVKIPTVYSGDTVYYRLRHRPPNMYVSFSLDGMTYTEETIVNDNNHRYLCFYDHSYYSGAPFTTYIDYCRFTKVTE